MKRLASLLFIAIIALTACSRTGASGEPIVIPTAVVTPGEVVGGQLVNAGVLPTLDDAPERPLYVLNVTLDYKEGNVHAQQRIEFLNPTGKNITEVKFNVPPARREGAVEFRDARIFGQANPLPFTLSDAVLTVQLPAPLAPDKAIALTFDFTFKVPLQEVITGIGGDDTSRGPLSLTCGHWYVMLAPYRNDAWDTPAYVPIGDPYTSELADYEVSILAPDGVVIAGAGDEVRAGRLWRYSLNKARVFAFAASNRYTVDQLDQNGVTFLHYGYPQHGKNAEAVLNTAARAVKLYSQLYGPYPYKLTARAEEVSEEDSKVTILDPSHPVFSGPNRITAADFDNWVEERGSKWLAEWDSRYQPLLECNDRGQAPQKGGLLIARYGKGTFTYAAYAFYRQLPAGVEGAYRLFANLISQ